MKNMVTVEQAESGDFGVLGSSGAISSPTAAARGPAILIPASPQQWLPAAPSATFVK
jgi:hypothetical protein